MLETLDARLAQAHAGELGHLDVLQVLCQDEISRQGTMALARRLRRARFETEATLEGFDFATAPKRGEYRIRYAIDEDANIIHILDIDHRRDAYRS